MGLCLQQVPLVALLCVMCRAGATVRYMRSSLLSDTWHVYLLTVSCFLKESSNAAVSLTVLAAFQSLIAVVMLTVQLTRSKSFGRCMT